MEPERKLASSEELKGKKKGGKLPVPVLVGIVLLVRTFRRIDRKYRRR